MHPPLPDRLHPVRVLTLSAVEYHDRVAALIPMANGHTVLSVGALTASRSRDTLNPCVRALPDSLCVPRCFRPRGVPHGDPRQRPVDRAPERLQEEISRGAHNSAAGPQGPGGQGQQDQDACPERLPAAPGRLHTRVHDYPEEAEFRPAEGGTGSTVLPGRGHCLHPRGRSQPAGTLDGSGSRRTSQGSAWRSLQDHSRNAGHSGREEPQAGAQPVWRKEGEVMPRKGPAPKRPVMVDPVYGSPLVSQLVSKILLDGKKTIAQGIVYTAMEGTRTKSGVDPVQTLKRALDNVRPSLEVKSRRVGGATYQVPVEVKPARATTLAMRWLVTFARQRREKTMSERLMNEILDASNGLGAAVKRREDTHKMAEANKAFAHYRW